MRSCGSEQTVGEQSSGVIISDRRSTNADNASSQAEYEDVSDDSLEEYDPVETNNQFAILQNDSSGDHLANNEIEETETVSMENSNQEHPKVKFYRNESEFDETEVVELEHHEVAKKGSLNNNSFTMENGVAIDTVRRFSGLDKAAVIGINPYVNEEHADFNKFVLSLATRAKDNLVIITTSDNIKQQLDKLV